MRGPFGKSRVLRELFMSPVPQFSHLSGIRLVLHICEMTYNDQPENILFSTSWVQSGESPLEEIPHYVPGDQQIKLHFQLECKNDIVIRCFHLQSHFKGTWTTQVPVFRIQFNCGFLPKSGKLELKKEDLDVGWKEKPEKLDDSFSVIMTFDEDVSEEKEVGSGTSDANWDEEAQRAFEKGYRDNVERMTETRDRKRTNRTSLNSAKKSAEPINHSNLFFEGWTEDMEQEVQEFAEQYDPMLHPSSTKEVNAEKEIIRIVDSMLVDEEKDRQAKISRLSTTVAAPLKNTRPRSNNVH